MSAHPVFSRNHPRVSAARWPRRAPIVSAGSARRAAHHVAAELDGRIPLIVDGGRDHAWTGIDHRRRAKRADRRFCGAARSRAEAAGGIRRGRGRSCAEHRIRKRRGSCRRITRRARRSVLVDDLGDIRCPAGKRCGAAGLEQAVARPCLPSHDA